MDSWTSYADRNRASGLESNDSGSSRGIFCGVLLGTFAWAVVVTVMLIV